MPMNRAVALAESLGLGIAVAVLLIMQVARCNDRIRRPIPGTLRTWAAVCSYK